MDLKRDQTNSCKHECPPMVRNCDYLDANFGSGSPLKKTCSWEGTTLHLSCSLISTCFWPQLEAGWIFRLTQYRCFIFPLQSSLGCHSIISGIRIMRKTVRKTEELWEMLTSMGWWGISGWVHRALSSETTLRWVRGCPVCGPRTVHLSPGLLLRSTVTALEHAFKSPPR